jgi:HK97 family phage major capsid protein/HK97 family phage prohead protease
VARTIKTSVFYRTAVLDRSAIDETTRTVKLSFSSEAPVNRVLNAELGQEVLDHNPSAIRLQRLQSTGPLLFNHDPDQHIGRIRSIGVSNGKLVGEATFSKSKLGEEKFRDVVDGILTETSIGYRVHKWDRQEQGNKVIFRAVDWEPLEGSLVTIPADLSVGVGKRNAEQFDTIMNNDTTDTTTQTRTLPDREQQIVELRNQQLERINKINAAAEALGKEFKEATEKFREMARGAVAKGTSPEDFNVELLAAIPGVRKVQKTDANLDMDALGVSPREQSQYSLGRAIQDCVRGGRRHPDTLEGEISNALATRCGQSAQGFWIPPHAPIATGNRSYSRDLNVSSATQGGNFVQTTIQTPIIEILRNRMVTARAGVQTLSGLQGNVAIPRQTGAATAYFVSEQGTLTKSTQVIDQVSVSPKRVGAFNAYSKELILQSSVDVENFIRDDLMKVLAIKVDNVILEGTGANTPTGILHTSGIGTVTFGVAATWAKVISFETAVATANADVGSMAYITSPTVRGTWKSAVKVASTGTFLWENALPMSFMGPAPDYGVGTAQPGMVNGYSAYATNNISGNLCAFGVWSDAILAMWGGLDVVVDPYAGKKEATVEIAVNSFVDVAVRHAVSFVWSTDSAAQ